MTDRNLTPSRFDVAVVGCGLSGLVAALHLQRAGHRVVILEKRRVPGGLCGTHFLDGYEFVVACNDFGFGFEREMRELGVAVEFYEAKARFHFDHGVFGLPPTPSTVLRLLPHAADIARFLRALRGAHEVYLGPLVARSVKSRSFAEMIYSLAYPLGRPPHELSVDALKAEFSKEYDYGYHRPRAPVGGPAALVEGMVQRFLSLGGTLELERECREVERGGPEGEEGKIAVTDCGRYAVREVVSSRGRWEEYPDDCKPGLAVSAFRIAVRKTLSYPRGVHMLVHLPADIPRWLSQIDSGEQPEAFGFHAFRSDLPERPDHYTMNVHLYLARGMEHPSADELRPVERYVFERLEEMLPGFAAALLYRRFVSPADFSEMHGLSSRITRVTPKAGFRKPETHDGQSDIYYVGNSVFPPGEHAGGAALSGRMAAEAVMRALARRRAPPQLPDRRFASAAISSSTSWWKRS